MDEALSDSCMFNFLYVGVSGSLALVLIMFYMFAHAFISLVMHVDFL
uniref:Uncharacterized protein n=1 Tax=Arundo donax TaxID=35708 RepID=A0A0A8YUK9_ARUDO